MTDTDHIQRTANTVRILSAEAVQKANSGHPGLPMGTADIAVTLWMQFLKHNPADPGWANRDRFVLSAGHGSMLLYSLLHLTGYDLSIEDIQNFRQWGSRTPGHPEYGHTPGVETTTGPLGQGISTAVGMALSERWLAKQYNRPDYPIVDHYTYVLASDGDLMEGISHESASLAGHLNLGKLIVCFDDNGICIDGPTNLTVSEDTAKRFEAYGWHTLSVDGHNAEEIASAIRTAQAETDRPSLILCRTTIGWGSPNKAGSHKVHGSPLGEEEVNHTREHLGWGDLPPFSVPDDVQEFCRSARTAGEEAQKAWNTLFDAYAKAHPELAEQFRTASKGELPSGWSADMPAFTAENGNLATRASSGKVLNHLATRVPALLGGSADLTPSNNTSLDGANSLKPDDFNGRYIHFGIREHGMGAIMNGMALHGGIIPYGGTFLVFSDYMRGAIRLSALMGLGVIYVFTHDSIGLGEDGPTHQPVEHLAALRAIPNLNVIRPADANETISAWKVAVERRNQPTALILSRQKLPLVTPADESGKRGAYTLVKSESPDLLLLATGSEVSLALKASEQLTKDGVNVSVVSMPSWELFEEQSEDYKQSVLPAGVPRLAVEAGISLGWHKYVGASGAVIALDRFGASAPGPLVMDKLGFNVDNIVQQAKKLL